MSKHYLENIGSCDTAFVAPRRVAQSHNSRGVICGHLLPISHFLSKSREFCRAHIVLRKLQDGVVWINSRGSSERTSVPVHRLCHPQVCLATDVVHCVSEDEEIDFSDQCRFL